MKSLISVLVPLLAAASAYAHGFVTDLTVAGKDYKGNIPGGQTDASVIRLVSDNSPVKGASNAALGCGAGAKPASLNANANPGDSIGFEWKGGSGDSNWPHEVGPMLTYMASCGDQTCDKFDSTQARWFKIQEVAYDSSGSKWAMAALTTGAPATITLPSNIAPGNYLIRHELIGLQNAMSQGGAEFYPSCSQLIVGGSGTGKPQDSELVSFPGAYSDSDPGILVNVYDGKINYQFPGPSVASFVGGSGSGSSDSSTSSSSSSGGSSSYTTGSSSSSHGSSSSSTSASYPSPSSGSSSSSDGSSSSTGSSTSGGSSSDGSSSSSDGSPSSDGSSSSGDSGSSSTDGSNSSTSTAAGPYPTSSSVNDSSAGGAAGSSPSSGANSLTDPSPTPSASASGSSTTKQCKSKKKSSSSSSNGGTSSASATNGKRSHYPRRISRVMRDLVQ